MKAILMIIFDIRGLLCDKFVSEEETTNKDYNLVAQKHLRKINLSRSLELCKSN